MERQMKKVIGLAALLLLVGSSLSAQELIPTPKQELKTDLEKIDGAKPKAELSKDGPPKCKDVANVTCSSNEDVKLCVCLAPMQMQTTYRCGCTPRKDNKINETLGQE